MKENSNWDNSCVREMTDLTYAKPTDLFIYTRFTAKKLEMIEGQQMLYTDSSMQAIEYVRHIFLYDILNDIADDIQYDFKTAFDERQSDMISVMNYWFKFGKLLQKNNLIEILKLNDEFNAEFNNRVKTEYEICILNGANELRTFLTNKYNEDARFDRKYLENICSKDLFVGKLLKDFIENLFNT